MVFFFTISIVSSTLSGQGISFSIIGLVVLLPLLIGTVCGVISGFILKIDQDDKMMLITLIVTILLTSLVGFYFNNYV